MLRLFRLAGKRTAESLRAEDAQEQWSAIRYCAALFVVFKHACAITGHLEPLGGFRGRLLIGHTGVLMFFAVSGYLLIQRSRDETLTSFVLARVLRIFPMLVAVDLLTILAGYFMNAETLFVTSLLASICVALPLHFLIEERARRLCSAILALWAQAPSGRRREEVAPGVAASKTAIGTGLEPAYE
jgi:peptidoglycan/LPS O-acetylase OafA/YrhL